MILFQKQQITVYHRRRERSLGTKPSAGFWFEWVLSITFDRELKVILSTGLKISDLSFEEETDPELREKVSNLLQNGDLILF